MVASATANLDPKIFSIIILYFHCLPSKIEKNNVSPISQEKEESGERKIEGGQGKSAVNSDAFSKLFR